jgi:hypothetical protein
MVIYQSPHPHRHHPVLLKPRELVFLKPDQPSIIFFLDTTLNPYYPVTIVYTLGQTGID